MKSSIIAAVYWVRWLLVVPAAVVAWYVALFASLLLVPLLDSLCPSHHKHSGTCYAPWYDTAFNVLVDFGAALAALLILVSCTWMAPAGRRWVAIATFIAGLGMTAYMGFKTAAYSSMSAAIVTGVFVLWILLRRLKRQQSPPSRVEWIT